MPALKSKAAPRRRFAAAVRAATVAAALCGLAAPAWGAGVCGEYARLARDGRHEWRNVARPAPNGDGSTVDPPYAAFHRCGVGEGPFGPALHCTRSARVGRTDPAPVLRRRRAVVSHSIAALAACRGVEVLVRCSTPLAYGARFLLGVRRPVFVTLVVNRTVEEGEDVVVKLHAFPIAPERVRDPRLRTCGGG